MPAHSSGGSPASGVNDATYKTTWRSKGVPAFIALDLSGVPAASRQHVLLAWYNHDTYGYDHALMGQPGYNSVGAYTIEAHASKGGGQPPQNGWVELASVQGNTMHSALHMLSLVGMNWVRLHFFAADGSPQNEDISINLDLHDIGGVAEDGAPDGWLFVGDSITANCMDHRPVGGEDGVRRGASFEVAAPSFAQQVAARLAGRYPAQENAGMPGWTAQQAAEHLPKWLKRFPGRYVTLNFGTNDAAGNVPPQTFFSQMSALVGQVQAAGKLAVVPSIPYAASDIHRRNIPALNAQIRKVQALPMVIAGPDLYSAFEADPTWLAADRLHPTAQGCAGYRASWADAAVQAVYGARR